jgi:hypothetical protein
VVRGKESYGTDGDGSVIFELPPPLTRSDIIDNIKNLERSLLQMSVHRKVADEICSIVDYDSSIAPLQDYTRGHSKLSEQARADPKIVQGIASSILQYDAPHAPLADDVITIAGAPYPPSYFKISGKINYRSPNMISFGDTVSLQSATSTCLRVMDTLRELCSCCRKRIFVRSEDFFWKQ